MSTMTPATPSAYVTALDGGMALDGAWPLDLGLSLFGSMASATVAAASITATTTTGATMSGA